MSRPPNITDQRWRAICDARYWLRNGYDTADQVEKLMHVITEKRGQAAADALKQEMRQQWKCRADWLEGGGDDRPGV